MTTELTKAAQQALEALEYAQGGNTWTGDQCRKAIAALERALTQRPTAQSEAQALAHNMMLWREDAVHNGNEYVPVHVRTLERVIAQLRDMPAPQQATPEPIPMVLHCPKCGTQHIDKADEPDKYCMTEADGSCSSADPRCMHQPIPQQRWTNPPHRSHLCHGCGTIWRPADVPTTGVKSISTSGKADTWVPGQAPQQAAGEPIGYVSPEALEELHMSGEPASIHPWRDRDDFVAVHTRPAPVETEPVGDAVYQYEVRLNTWIDVEKYVFEHHKANSEGDTRVLYTRPAPGVPEGFALVPMTEDELNEMALQLGREMKGLRCWGWMDLVRAVERHHSDMLAAAQAKKGE